VRRVGCSPPPHSRWIERSGEAARQTSASRMVLRLTLAILFKSLIASGGNITRSLLRLLDTKSPALARYWHCSVLHEDIVNTFPAGAISPGSMNKNNILNGATFILRADYAAAPQQIAATRNNLKKFIAESNENSRCDIKRGGIRSFSKTSLCGSRFDSSALRPDVLEDESGNDESKKDSNNTVADVI